MIDKKINGYIMSFLHNGISKLCPDVLFEQLPALGAACRVGFQLLRQCARAAAQFVEAVVGGGLFSRQLFDGGGVDGGKCRRTARLVVGCQDSALAHAALGFVDAACRRLYILAQTAYVRRLQCGELCEPVTAHPGGGGEVDE